MSIILSGRQKSDILSIEKSVQDETHNQEVAVIGKCLLDGY